MMEMGNPVTVCETQSPTTHNTNSQMPSLDHMLNSVVGSAGDLAPHSKRLKLDTNEDLSDVAKLQKKFVMQDEEKQKGGATKDGSLGVGNVVALVGDCSLGASGNGESNDKTCGNGRKCESSVETLAKGKALEAESGEGNSGGLGSGVDRTLASSDATLASALSPQKRVGAKSKKRKPPSLLQE